MASIRDIAKMAGVSAASVSRILNHDETFSINNHTRQRVLEIAEKVHYSKDKNIQAQRQLSDELSIILITRHTEADEDNDPYFRMIHQAIKKEAARWRLKVVLGFRMKDKEKNWEQLSKYGAVIVIGEMTEAGIRKIEKYNKKIILVDNYQDYSEYDSIQTDFATRIHEILNVLYQKKHRHIAFIGGLGSAVSEAGEVKRYPEEIRAENYRLWMQAKGLQAQINIFQGGWTFDDGVKLGQKMLDIAPDTTAVVVASDPLSAGVYQAINERGKRIPEDISVVSFDDIEQSKLLHPPLSSVRMKAEEMGHLAVGMAKERILNNRTIPIRIVCASQLILRDSVGERRLKADDLKKL